MKTAKRLVEPDSYHGVWVSPADRERGTYSVRDLEQPLREVVAPEEHHGVWVSPADRERGTYSVRDVEAKTQNRHNETVTAF